MKLNYRNYNWLYKQYITNKLSTIKIGKICGVTATTILKYLSRLNIPTRSHSEASKGYKKTDKHIRNIAKGLRKRYVDPAKHGSWKGGRIKISQGYIMIKAKDHPYTGTTGYILEHRLVAEKYLSRYLNPNEVVHHINENRHDNRPQNLYVFSNNQIHLAHHRSGKSIKSNLPISIKHKA